MLRATAALSYPDLMIQGESKGKSGAPGAYMVSDDGPLITYNKDTETPYRYMFAHEGGHHMEAHGLTALVNRIMFGDPDQGIPGVYVKMEDGKPVYQRNTETGELILDDVTGKPMFELSDDFRKLEADYMLSLIHI